ncbi:MAG: cobalt ECF transporter T component CbiQ [Lachnospiraceae bacterium]
MNRFDALLNEIDHLEQINLQKSFLHERNPVINLLTAFLTIFAVVSFQSEQLLMLMSIGLLLLVQFELADLKLLQFFLHIRLILPILLLFGIANPFFDKNVVFYLAGIGITSGMISMASLFLKGMFCLAAAYLLISITGIEGICYALRKLHLPKLIVTIIMLIYRYLILLLKETRNLTLAYSLRAVSQKGIHIKVWGSLAGLLLLRSIDRAQDVYESMSLRGFSGEYFLKRVEGITRIDVAYLSVVFVVLMVFRILPVFELIGSLFQT